MQEKDFVPTLAESFKSSDGTKTWTFTVEGVFRHADSLATGLATQRLQEDDIVIPVIHFTKDNQEMSSVAVDDHTKIEIVT